MEKNVLNLILLYLDAIICDNGVRVIMGVFMKLFVHCNGMLLQAIFGRRGRQVAIEYKLGALAI